MLSRPSATLSLNEPAQQVLPRSATRASDPARDPDTLAKTSVTLPEIGNQQLQPDPLLAASLMTSMPRQGTAARGSTSGILLYLLSVAFVAAATIGVFFGAGFFLLAHPTEEMIAGSGTRDRGTEVGPTSSGSFLRPHSDAPPVPAETQSLRSVAAAALPVSPLAQSPAAHEALSMENGDAALGSVPERPAGATAVNAAGSAPSAGKVPALRSTSHKASLTTHGQTTPALRSPVRKGTLTPPAHTEPAQK
jgi:hypothetical protein